jgi:hypothetical protein
MSATSDQSLVLPPAMIAALRARHVAFLAERLVDDRAKGDFVRSFGAMYDHLLAQPLRSLIDPERLVEGGARILTNEVIRGLVAPIVREVNRRATLSMRSDDAKLGSYVPEEARAAIDELVRRPDLVPEELVRKVFDQDIVEEIMHDTIYDALVEFNQSVNPFFADWGVPALVKRLVPIGSGTILKSMNAVRTEFDKRLEPEIRKFLLGFCRRAKKKLADFVIASAGDPKLVALRQSIVTFLYEQSLASLTKNVDDDARMSADAAGEAITVRVVRDDHARARLRAELEKLLEAHGDDSLGAWLGRIGVTERPDLEPLAELLWPWMRLALTSPPARAFYERVTWDFYATIATDP